MMGYAQRERVVMVANTEVRIMVGHLVAYLKDAIISLSFFLKVVFMNIPFVGKCGTHSCIWVGIIYIFVSILNNTMF